jgi:hypothetical protein
MAFYPSREANLLSQIQILKTDNFSGTLASSICDKSLNMGNTGEQKNILDLLRAALRVIRTSGRDIDSGVGVIPQ